MKIKEIKVIVCSPGRNFTTVKHAKPPASRKGSVDWFVVAQGFKGRVEVRTDDEG